MRRVLVLLFLFFHVAAFSQVRVRHGIRFPHVSFKKRHTKHKTAHKPRKPAKAIIKVSQPVAEEKPFNELYHSKWDKSKKLVYDDFKCTDAPCKPFVDETETDLLKKVYPNYQAFYRMLEKRRRADSAQGVVGNSTGLAFNLKLDSMDVGYNYSVYVDQNTLFNKEIDSPAASALMISPVIYSLDDTTFYYNIAALFSKYESWMIIKSADILQHEQIHFDIFELHARKLRKQWVALLKKNEENGTIYDIINQLSPFYDNLYAELEKMQLHFDEETAALTANNESLLQLNAEWEKRVKKDLDELREYEKSEGVVILKGR
jgi:hypothetical protein